MPRRIVFLLLVGATLAASVSVAWAINRSATSILIQRDPSFHGLVQSSDQCTPDRTVLLKIEKSDRDRTVGRTHTDAEGNWEITDANANHPLHQGDYYAKAKRVILADGHICKRGTSQTIQLQP